ncbi:hypothetical protein KGM_213035 [Danaus plexippus plexippus]|uniref:Uncharacterized protein n=1 Tax=Danaus plexippus plexippus TaxID=278856 RepID=A0A212EQA3_DANPL|nr:hypothetical protein KGM_213035 [Danaus plexippus plexippus]
MKANGSRREEREEKISRKKSGASPGREEKNSRASRRWAEGGEEGIAGGVECASRMHFAGPRVAAVGRAAPSCRSLFAFSPR